MKKAKKPFKTPGRNIRSYQRWPEGVDESVLYVRHVPTSLKNQFKVWCLRRGRSMTHQLIQMMKKAVEGDSE